MSRRALAPLLQLSRLKALKDQLVSAREDKKADETRKAVSDLRGLDQVQSLDDENIKGAKQQISWQRWRQVEMRRLQISMAQHEVTMIPIRRAAARSTARADMLESFASRGPLKGRAGRLK